MAVDRRVAEHVRAIAEIAELEVSDAQAERVAEQLLVLLRRPPPDPGGADLGATEPAFGLQVRRP